MREKLEFWRPSALGVIGVSAVTAVILAVMGRVWWCKCGSPAPWAWDVWSMHNSQHILDPYTFSHVLHGVMFYGLLFIVLRGRFPRAGVVIAAALEGAWEIVENTPMVIDRYRENTASLDYTGDSVANSIADIAACVCGYAFAAAVPVWVSAVGFAVTELLLVLWIKDSLILNMIMLVYPLDAVKQWQMPEGP